MVEAGLSESATSSQSDCVIFRKGRVYSLSREIACSIISGLPEELDGAIAAHRLIQLLRRMPDDIVEMEARNGDLLIEGEHERLASFSIAKIEAPIGLVERPKEWLPLDESFAEAVRMVAACTKKKGAFLHECIHIQKDHMEASDNLRMIRYQIQTPVNRPILVRATTLRSMTDLGMTKIAITEEWLHFRNPAGLRLSLRAYLPERYPPLEDFLRIRGQSVLLPDGITDMTRRAAITSEDESVEISIHKNRLYVEGKCREAKYREAKKIRYQGPDLSFMIPHRLLVDLTQGHRSCEVCEHSLRAEADKYTLAVSLATRQ